MLRIVATLMLALVALAGPARAQTPNVSGEWNTTADVYGVMRMTLRQEGTTVTGVVGSHGKIQAAMQGNVLRGTYADIMSSGTVEFVFDPEGRRFNGMFFVGGPNSNGRRRWSGTRTGDVAATPASVIETRAGLAELSGSSMPPPEQAFKACANLLGNTFLIDGQDKSWRTRIAVQQNSFAPVLGAPQGGVVYVLQLGGPRLLQPEIVPLSPTDSRNGWQFLAKVAVVAESYQLSTQAQAQDWRPLPQKLPVLVCTFSIRNGRPGLTAEVLLGRVTGVELPNMATWSRS